MRVTPLLRHAFRSETLMGSRGPAGFPNDASFQARLSLDVKKNKRGFFPHDRIYYEIAE